MYFVIFIGSWTLLEAPKKFGGGNAPPRPPPPSPGCNLSYPKPQSNSQDPDLVSWSCRTTSAFRRRAPEQDKLDTPVRSHGSCFTRLLICINSYCKSNNKTPPLNLTSVVWKQIVVKHDIRIHTNQPPCKIVTHCYEIKLDTRCEKTDMGTERFYFYSVVVQLLARPFAFALTWEPSIDATDCGNP